MSNSTEAAAIAELVQLHSLSRVAMYCTVVAYVWALYDYGQSLNSLHLQPRFWCTYGQHKVITLGDEVSTSFSIIFLIDVSDLLLNNEVEYVWMKPWNFAKFLFLWTRYFGFILLTIVMGIQFSPNHSKAYPSGYNILLLSASYRCEAYFYGQGSGGCVMLYTVEVVLQFRIYAMYNRNKKLMMGIGILFILEIAAQIVVYNVGIHNGTTIPTPEGLTGCFGTSTKYLFSIWLPGLAFELVLLCLAVWKGFRTSRTTITLAGNKVNMISVLVRDSIAVGLFTNAMLWFAAPEGLDEVAVSMSHASMIIGGSRLLLNVRSAYYGPLNPTETSTFLQENSVISSPHFRTGYNRRLRDRLDNFFTNTELITMPTTYFEEPETDLELSEIGGPTMVFSEVNGL
ncbi:hypothetical protein NEOLEDRAFT_1141865 [Neolentinus lepideus HHB14362 ss-1]|uniref:DUF6533 domain-containing protein n=1 Tax=Neolentinus lepideus HHB14362 ss-1 TaxID=1314782 RepID=A0A165NGG3_9AGAM|nr:hypothetical protein NEOLEDRAFT_1141865 [Neolentinus lepideus HHB14362 ss-1]